MAMDLRGGAPGSFFTHHDARYHFAADLSGGTLVDSAGNPANVSRRTLPPTGTSSVSGMWAIDANWRAVALRWGWCSETVAPAGNVTFRVRYNLSYPLLGGDVIGAALTTIAVPPQAAPTGEGVSTYSLPTSTAAIATPVDGFLGTAPMMLYSIDRLGDDAGDTAVQTIGIWISTITRID